MNRTTYSWLSIAILVTSLILTPHLAFAQKLQIDIVSGYEGMGQYAAAAIGKTEAERVVLYDRHVNQPYRNRCSGEGRGRTFSRRMLETPIADIEALATAVEKIKENRVEDEIRKALLESARLLPTEKITVCLFPFPPDHNMADFVRDEMYGLMGIAEAPGIFWLQPIPAKGWLTQIPYGTAHEYHHAVSYGDDLFSDERNTLLERIVAEGRADTFAAMLFPERAPRWTSALTHQQEVDVWSAMQPYLHSRDDETVRRFVAVSGDENLPLFAAYSIGFRIAQSYLAQNPNEPPAHWANLDAMTFLSKSGYGAGAQ